MPQGDHAFERSRGAGAIDIAVELALPNGKEGLE
jgi:hypothetical protein|tara:strand:- start:433 stop:534 length:102 start_codon:yes stop_codon:yes gene_type:complete